MRNRRRARRRFARGKKARAICDRSGFEIAYKDSVIEPGTGIRVDKRWSDGMWNRVDHPQNFPADTSENIGLRDPRTDTYESGVEFLTDEDGVIITGEDGFPIFAL